MGILWGNVDYNKYYVFNYLPILILNNEEINWLKKIWNKYTKSKSPYLGKHNIQTKYDVHILK